MHPMSNESFVWKCYRQRLKFIAFPSFRDNHNRSLFGLDQFCGHDLKPSGGVMWCTVSYIQKLFPHAKLSAFDSHSSAIFQLFFFSFFYCLRINTVFVQLLEKMCENFWFESCRLTVLTKLNLAHDSEDGFTFDTHISGIKWYSTIFGFHLFIFNDKFKFILPNMMLIKNCTCLFIELFAFSIPFSRCSVCKCFQPICKLDKWYQIYPLPQFFKL